MPTRNLSPSGVQSGVLLPSDSRFSTHRSVAIVCLDCNELRLFIVEKEAKIDDLIFICPDCKKEISGPKKAKDKKK